ncbi:MAG: hypothetical protein JEY94_17275 [Melioribacteraceae bacterium]|nr:hypothetical protein [Melioribacteraceae bacterium]
MKKQELLDKYVKRLRIENYSEQTVGNYLSAIKQFFEYIIEIEAREIDDKLIENLFANYKLFLCVLQMLR